MMLISNLGSTFVYLNLIIIAFFLLLATQIHCGFSRVIKINQWLKQKLIWSYPLRFMMQQYPPIIISGLINLYDFRLETPGKALSSVLSIVLLALTQLISVALFIKLNRKPSSPESLIEGSFSTLFEGLT